MALRLGYSIQLLQKVGHSSGMLMTKTAYLTDNSKSKESSSQKSYSTDRVKDPRNKSDPRIEDEITLKTHHGNSTSSEEIVKAERNEVKIDKGHNIETTDESLPESKPFKPEYKRGKELIDKIDRNFKSEFKSKVSKPKSTCTIL